MHRREPGRTRVLVAWIGITDLRAPTEEAQVGLGPIANALQVPGTYERVALLDNLPIDDARVPVYVDWIKSRTSAVVDHRRVKLRSPTHFGDIYRAAIEVVDGLERLPAGDLTLHTSPGTPAMTAVWLILGRTRYPRATLIESSREHGVRPVEFPFELSAELIPDLLRGPDADLARQSGAPPPAAPEFAAIVHRSEVMAREIDRARRVALRSVPVLLEGETGTGKELFARAIHSASPRAKGPFVPVNCGALPPELIESILFGHSRGAFTGASADRQGVFEAADGGTLFLDEVGELPLSAQVKLLRVLQEGEVTRVGEAKPRRIDARIIAATHRNLLEGVAARRFREDLFYRLAVAILRLPPLRERKGDLGLIVDHLLDRLNEELAQQPGYTPRRLTPAARNLLLQHPWPGNVRELYNTLLRATLWLDGAKIGVEAIREALLPCATPEQHGLLGRPLGGGFELQEVLDQVSRDYIRRALDEAGGVKSKAAELVGLRSHQRLSNWITRLGL